MPLPLIILEGWKVKTIDAWICLLLAELLLKLMSRIIRVCLVIKDALQSHKGKERSK